MKFIVITETESDPCPFLSGIENVEEVFLTKTERVNKRNLAEAMGQKRLLPSEALRMWMKEGTGHRTDGDDYLRELDGESYWTVEFETLEEFANFLSALNVSVTFCTELGGVNTQGMLTICINNTEADGYSDDYR